MNSSITNYNALTPFMNALKEEGYTIYEKCDRLVGYGFYAEGMNGHYVNVLIWGDRISVHLIRHCSKYGHDVINDVGLKYSPNLTEISKVEETVRQYLKETEGLARQLQIHLTESEVMRLIDLCSAYSADVKLKAKLENYLNRKGKEV